MKSLKIFIIVMLGIVYATNAQFKANIKLLAKSKATGVWLRWAPVDPPAWQLGNKYGYKLERLTLLPDGKMLSNSKVMLTKEPVKPYSEEEFNAASNTYDEVGAVQELLYGKSYRSKNFSSTDIQAIVKNHRELENRFGLTLLMSDISQAAAKSAGLFWIDASAEKGKRYVYRISIATPDPQFEPVGIIMTTTLDEVLPPVKEITSAFVDRKVTLSWPTLLHRGIYTAYYIEKSVDGKVFKRITDMPYVSMSDSPDSDVSHFVDSLDVNRKTYYYRINGISPFAETGPYSNIIKGEGKDDLTGLIVISEGKVLQQRNIQITWEFPDVAEKLIQGFIVSRASKHDGPYVDLTKKPISKTTRLYISETPHNNSYYKVRGINKNGDEVAISFPYLVQIADETPPAIPAGVTGEISDKGIATLAWKPNTDKDILGYRVFQKNSHDEEYIEATKTILLKPSFVDSVNIRVLNRKIIYSIVAVDKNYNPSDYSVPLKLLRPDKISPAPPVFNRTETIKDTIALSWINSVSTDIEKAELYKINSEKRDTTLLKNWTPVKPLDNYNDLATIPGESYRYRIVAYDSSGNSCQTTSREVFFEPGFRSAVTELTDSVDRVNRKITLRWKNVQSPVRCIVYRKINDQPIKILATLEGNVEVFVDTKISANNIYIYKVQPVYQGGVRALISKEIKVTY